MSHGPKNPDLLSIESWMVNDGILIIVYYNPYLTGYYNPLYNPTNQGFFHCSNVGTTPEFTNMTGWKTNHE